MAMLATTATTTARRPPPPGREERVAAPAARIAEGADRLDGDAGHDRHDESSQAPPAQPGDDRHQQPDQERENVRQVARSVAGACPEVGAGEDVELHQDGGHGGPLEERIWPASVTPL